MTVSGRSPMSEPMRLNLLIGGDIALFHDHININPDNFPHRRLASTAFLAAGLVESIALVSSLSAPMFSPPSRAILALWHRRSAAHISRCLWRNVVPSWSCHHGARLAALPKLNAHRLSCHHRDQIPWSFPCRFTPLLCPPPLTDLCRSA